MSRVQQHNRLNGCSQRASCGWQHWCQNDDECSWLPHHTPAPVSARSSYTGVTVMHCPLSWEVGFEMYLDLRGPVSASRCEHIQEPPRHLHEPCLSPRQAGQDPNEPLIKNILLAFTTSCIRIWWSSTVAMITPPWSDHHAMTSWNWEERYFITPTIWIWFWQSVCVKEKENVKGTTFISA